MKKIIWSLMIGALCMVSCKQEQPAEYDSVPGIYFFRSGNAGEQRDSLEFAFYVKGAPTGTTFNQELTLLTVGMPESHARAFTLRQTNAGQPDAAVAGKHFVPFDDPKMIEVMKIPANATAYNVPIMCINDTELGAKKVRLEVEIVPNGEFNQGVQAQSKFVIWFGDIAVRPSTWKVNGSGRDWTVYFGDWSAVKMRYIANEIGLVDFDLEMMGNEAQGILSTTTARMLYYGRTMYGKLQEYNAAHDPMEDEDGNVITFVKPS